MSKKRIKSKVTDVIILFSNMHPDFKEYLLGNLKLDGTYFIRYNHHEKIPKFEQDRYVGFGDYKRYVTNPKYRLFFDMGAFENTPLNIEIAKSLIEEMEDNLSAGYSSQKSPKNIKGVVIHQNSIQGDWNPVRKNDNIMHLNVGEDIPYFGIFKTIDSFFDLR